MSITDSIDTL